VSRTDTSIVVVAALLVASLYGLLWQRGPIGGEASIWVAGQETMRLPLAIDRRLEVKGAIGVSVVEVADGAVRVLDSPGPRKICVRMGWLREVGESAICLPNQVVVRVEGDQPRFDAMNF
jgi:hypothetical protein